MGSRTVNLLLQLVLAVVIVYLGYMLYDSITGPARELARQEQLEETTRDRMDFLRQSLIQYERANRRFMTSLDSVVAYAEADSALMALAVRKFGQGANLDSVRFSPISGEEFQLAVNDTSSVKVYRLDDAATGYYIGTMDADNLAGRNVASWE